MYVLRMAKTFPNYVYFSDFLTINFIFYLYKHMLFSVNQSIVYSDEVWS